MKKIFTFLVAFTLLGSVSFADCTDNCQKMPANSSCGCKDKCYNGEKKDDFKNPCDKKECFEKKDCTKKYDKSLIDDDEYCVYNQCYFDKHYRKMKKMLCLSSKQEVCIDNIYKSFKLDMESMHAKYRNEKNKLLNMIECDNDCYREQVKVLKELRNEAKEKCKEFRLDVKEQLCKSQYSDFRKFQRQEKRKMKKIIKYGKIYKLPCSNCCK